VCVSTHIYYALMHLITYLLACLNRHLHFLIFLPFSSLIFMHLTLFLPSTPQCITIIIFCTVAIIILTIIITITTTITTNITTNTNTTTFLREGRRAALSPATIRVLYSLQLEMDSTLPIKVAAQCRLWAEEKYVRYDMYAMMCLTAHNNDIMMIIVCC
jgi:hypothetical protein